MLLLFSLSGFSQESRTDLQGTIKVRKYNVKDNSAVSIAEVMPGFTGGNIKLMEYLIRKIKYPDSAKTYGIQGKVYVGFVVDKDGSIDNIQLLRGIGFGCDEIALKVIKSMPNWIPGEQRGEKIRVKYTLPIAFKLQ